MKKKVLSVIMSAVLTVGLAASLGACGSSSGGTATESTAVESTAAESTAAESTVEETAESAVEESVAEESAVPADESTAAAETPEANGPELEVTGGTIRGMTNEDGSVNIFKGIPYAAPPVGELRWHAPEAVVPWEGVKDCVEYSAAAIQPEQAPFLMWTEEFIIDPTKGYSEDCLYLNVWAPENAENAPVVFYIHGGGNTSGGASCEVYDGEEIAKKGIVYVDINYRVGIFGFLASTELSAESADGVSGNYAIQDMIAALKWVQNNISTFGGDPANVTISGQSAGSLNVNMLTICPEAEGLFKNAVTMSYNLVQSQLVTLADKEAEGDAIFAGKTLEEMRALDSAAVQELSGSDLATAVANYNIDNKYVIGNYDDVLKEQKGLAVNVMSGWVTNDPAMFGSFLTGSSLLTPDVTNPTTVDEYKEAVNAKLGDKAEEFLALYPVESDDQVAAAVAETDFDSYIASQTYNAQLRSENSDAPTYVYMYTHVMPGPEAEAMGAFHTSEVPYFINHLDKARADYWTDTDKELADTMSNMLVNFATTGDPNGDNTPEWPAYSADSEDITYMELGDTCEVRTMTAEKSAFWTAFYN